MRSTSNCSIRVGLFSRRLGGSTWSEAQCKFTAVLELCQALVNVKRGDEIRPGEEWRGDAQAAALKFVKHLLSVHAICAGTGPADLHGQASHVDHSSMLVIGRAAVEAFWVFAYIFRAPTAEKRIYRYTAWQLAGFLERQKHTAQDPAHRQKQDAEATTISELRSKLHQMPEFLALSQGDQRQVDRGKWTHPLLWKGIATAAGFSEGYYERIYSYLCSYAHSSYLSILQMDQARTLADQRMLGGTILQICTYTMARFVTEYLALFPEAEAARSANPALARLARTWEFDRSLLDAAFPRKDR